jgi:histidyl-tRNA synthetase
MAKDKKPRRPKAETPRGFRDWFGAEVAERNAMLARITETYHAHGFDPLESSAVETVEALGKFLPDVDRPNDGVFAWQDEDEGWLALRYDLTAPLARVYAQHRNSLRRRPGLAQREARPRPLPAVLPMRRRHGRLRLPGGRCRDLRNARRSP